MAAVKGRYMFVIGLVLVVSAGVSRAECVDLTVDSEILVKPIRDALHLTRGPADVAHKQTVRRYIAEFFRNASSIASSHANKSFVEEQAFDGDSNDDGMNIIYALKSDNWGKSEDKVLVVGANYDTANSETPGVDDNGSGMAALLETARLMSSLADTCSSNTTIMFVAFDIQSGEQSGYDAFAKHYLIVNVLQKFEIPGDNFRGALLFKSLMNYDVTAKSQNVPLEIFTVASDAVNDIIARGYRGDFLAAVSLSNGAGALLKSFDDHWIQLSARVASGLKPKLYDFEIPITLALSEFREAIEEFAHAGVFSFWESLVSYAGGNFNIVILTDTANLRGYMMRCDLHACDDLTTALTSDNIEFLRFTTTTVVQYLALEFHCPTCIVESTPTEAPTAAPSENSARTAEGSLLVIYAMLAFRLLAAF